MSTPSQLDILIEIRAKLDQLTRGTDAMHDLAEETRDASEATNSLEAGFKTGLGIEVARRAITMLTGELHEAIGYTSQLSDEIERAGVRAGLSGEMYQALTYHLRQAGGEAGELTAAMEFLRRGLGEAGDPKSGQAGALKEIGLSVRQLTGLSIELQFERIARGLARVENEERRAALTAQLLGRGSASLNDLLGQLATRGLGDLSREAQRSAGIMADEVAAAIDKAGDEAQAAQEKLGKMFAPFTIKAAEARGEIAKLKAALAETIMQRPGQVAATIAVTGAAAVGAGAVASGGFGSATAWGLLAGAAVAKAAATTVPMWMSVGAVIAAAASAAWIINMRSEAAANKAEIAKANKDFTRGRAFTLADSLNEARDPAMVERVRAEAARRAREHGRQGVLAGDNAEEKQRQLDLQNMYLAVERRAEKAGAAIVATNRKLDEDNAVKAAAEKAGRAWQDLSEEEQAYAADASKRRGDEIASLAEWSIQQTLAKDNTRRANAQLASDEVERLKKITTAEREAELVTRNAAASALQDEISRTASRADIDPATKQRKLNELYDQTRNALADIVALKDAELKLTASDDPVKRAQLEAEIAALKTQSATLGAGDPATGIGGYRERAGARLNGPDAISAGEGVEAGMLGYVSSLGSQGEQVAGALQSSIGTVVNGISDGIYGWITGAQSFGDVMRSMAGNLLKTLLDTVVQMGAQWVINAALAKGSLVSTFLVSMGLRKAETADVIASEAAKAPAIQANAAGASISSFGMAAVLGIAALVAAMALFGGFSGGGYTGPGGVNEVAGTVHRGEVVWSQRDVANAGGVSAVEAMRLGGVESYAIPAPVVAQSVASAPSLDVSAAIAASAAAAPPKEKYLVMLAENYTDIAKIKRQVGWDRAVVETVRNNIGDILG